MSKLLLITATLVFSANLFAAKTYNLTLRVTSLATHSTLPGFTVMAVFKEEKVKMGQTNQHGEIVISDLKEKSITFIITDPTKKHRQENYLYFNPKKEDQTKNVALRLNADQEAAFFQAIDEKYPNIPDLDAIDTNDFVDAEPVGGIAEFHNYMIMTMEYPGECVENNIQGKVFISFLVQKDGTITHAVVDKSAHPLLDAEALRIIRYAAKWNPATSGGKPVVTRVKVPLVFSMM